MRFIRISDLEGTVRSEWTMPAISNYSEWVFPEIDWVSNNTVFLSSPDKGGNWMNSPLRFA